MGGYGIYPKLLRWTGLIASILYLRKKKNS